MLKGINMQDALDWGQRYMTQAEWDGVNDSEERGMVAATDGEDGAPEASLATTPGGAPSRLEPGVPPTSPDDDDCQMGLF